MACCCVPWSKALAVPIWTTCRPPVANCGCVALTRDRTNSSRLPLPPTASELPVKQKRSQPQPQRQNLPMLPPKSQKRRQTPSCPRLRSPPCPQLLPQRVPLPPNRSDGKPWGRFAARSQPPLPPPLAVTPLCRRNSPSSRDRLSKRGDGCANRPDAAPQARWTSKLRSQPLPATVPAPRFPCNQSG